MTIFSKNDDTYARFTETMTYTDGKKKSQHQEGVVLDKQNFVGMFIHLINDVSSNFTLGT